MREPLAEDGDFSGILIMNRHNHCNIAQLADPGSLQLIQRAPYPRNAISRLGHYGLGHYGLGFRFPFFLFAQGTPMLRNSQRLYHIEKG